MTELTLISLDKIDPNPWQPRTSEDAEHIENIARSIAADGLLQPPVAREVPPSNSPQTGEHGLGGEIRYQMAFGHTRYKAFKFLAGQAGEWFEANGFDLADSIKQTAILFGVALPECFFDLARQMQAEIDWRFPAEKPVSVETVSVP